MAREFTEFTLDNGLKVALQSTPTQTIAARLKVYHGALHEVPGEEGLAHFLEHCLMTGGTSNYSPEQVQHILLNFGSYNAFTSLDKTFFPVDLLPDSLEKYLDFVSDLVFRPRIDEGKMDQERQRVLRETADQKSAPNFKDQEAYSKAFFGEGSPQTYFILGVEEVVQQATRQNLLDFHKRGYSPNNMDLIIVGALPENTEEIISKYFANEPAGPGEKFIMPTPRPILGPTKIHSYAPEMLNEDRPEESSAGLAIAIPAPDRNSGESYALRFLNNILGVAPMSSRLFRRVSQQEGLAYQIGSSYHLDDGTSMLTIGATVLSRKSDQAIDSIFTEMGRLKQELVSSDELNAAKRAVIYAVAKNQETNSGKIGGIEVSWETNVEIDEYLANMKAVTPEMVREVAQKYLPSEDGNYVMLLRDPLKQ